MFPQKKIKGKSKTWGELSSINFFFEETFFGKIFLCHFDFKKDVLYVIFFFFFF